MEQTKKISRKVISIVLSLLMVFSCFSGMGLTAFAAGEKAYAAYDVTTETNKTKSGDALTALQVTFNGKKWYIIEDNSTSATEGTVTLLSKECVGASKFGTNNTYSGSTVETVVNDYYTNSISSNVKSAIVDSKMFLLTYAQASTIYNANPDVLKCSQASGADFNAWWLCSPGDYATTGSSVQGDDGHVYVNGTYVGDPIGVRPALKLDLSKVEFNSSSKTFAMAKSAYADLKNTTTVITFDNKQWYLIEDNSTSATEGTVTLLSKECVGASKFDSNGSSNTYSGSTVETYVNNWYTSKISADAKAAVDGNGMFLLTSDQASALSSGVRKCSQASGADMNLWWLCTPFSYYLEVMSVDGDYGVVRDDVDDGTNVDDTLGVRPALKLDLSKVEFDSSSKTFALPAPSAYADYLPAEADDATALAAKVVKFNGYDWYLIEDNSTSETEGTVTLFAADTSFGATQFNSSNYANKYSTSTVKTYLDGMTETGGAFADVADAIETVTVTTNNDTDVTAKLYLLSKSEAEALPANVLMLGNFTNADYNGSVYWLRSPDPNDGMDAAYVNCPDGTIHNGIQVYRTYGVRPALQLDLSKVEFDSETKTFAVPTPAHTHDFSYSTGYNAIIAECTADGCTLDDGTEQHNHIITLNIVAPTLTTYGQTGEGISAEATLDGLDAFNAATGLNVSATDIKYYEPEEFFPGYTRPGEELEGAPTDAGTYFAGITISDVKINETDTSNVSAYVSYTIAKADPTYTAPTGVTATYGDTLADIAIPTGWTWADNTASVGNAGTNTFKANFTPADTANYNTVNNVDVTVTVAKANQTAPAAPTEAGKTINSITLNEIPNGEYKCGAGDWQTSPTFTGLDQNKGYVFRQRYAADANHNASAGSEETVIRTSNHTHSFTYSSSNGTITATCNGAGTCNLTDNKVSFTLTAPAAGESGLVYDGTDKKATLEGVDAFNAATGLNVSADDIVYNDLTNVVTETKNAGTYQALYTLQTDFPRPFVGITFTVAKANPTYTAPTGVTATYGDTLADVALPDGWAWVDDTTSVGDAGTKTFKANFTPADTTNYNVVENVDVTVKVNPADITPTVTLEGWTYGDEANTPSVTGNAGNGDVAYTYAQKGSDNFSATVPTNAGNYTVKATIAATTNYNGATATADFTITKADPTYTVPTGLTATYGDTLADIALPTGWTWADNTASVGNAGTNTFKANFTPADTTNYNIVENIDVSVTVGKAAGKDAFINTDTMSYSDNTINIEGVAGQEYIIVPKGTTVDEMSWDNAVLPDPDRDNWVFFDNLTPATEYEIYTRTAETENSFASEAVKANVYTTLSCIGWNYDSTLVGATITIEVEPETEGLTYKWYQDIITTDEEDREHHTLTEIPDATGTSYTFREEDVGKYIAVKIFAGDSEVGDTVTMDPVALGATIVFDSMSGSEIETLTGIGYQAKITKPADPTRDGYAFGGWYKDAECTEAFDFDTPVTENITLYAKWTEISDGITYLRGDANLDGTVDIIDIVLIRAHIVNMQSLTGTNLIVADANADETVDIIDVAMIRDYIVKETPLDTVTIYD